MKPDAIQDPDSVTSQLLINQAGIESLIEVICRLAGIQGVTEFNGVPINEFFERLRVQKLDANMEILAHLDPPLAARIRLIVDQTKKSAGFDTGSKPRQNGL